MLLQSILPRLPVTLAETLVYVAAAAGAIMITYGVFLEQERRQDLVKFIGAACLFVYALFTGDKIFMIAMAGLGLASLIEFAEIMFGLHKHSPEDLKRYKKLR
ncbi:MAG: hypothetical protein UY92_C0004G0081 [Candidatus Magasanikbacteria bacterium GW2011_GWA2_56_11]|uniref:Uncharacterized protein n=1 Tax=Candidatus Magasanikbacteria bacterium GW2011_GWA2_56_11 TaxID=1619044 RepID=A0A0G1YHS2_9BACT|nr:MAG: hypothetical protein UY92_C0004G0081 [Candidatus Magasanikbacteria bacterium GW2011_GWA2_56_11]